MGLLASALRDAILLGHSIDPAIALCTLVPWEPLRQGRATAHQLHMPGFPLRVRSCFADKARRHWASQNTERVCPAAGAHMPSAFPACSGLQPLPCSCLECPFSFPWRLEYVLPCRDQGWAGRKRLCACACKLTHRLHVLQAFQSPDSMSCKHSSHQTPCPASIPVTRLHVLQAFQSPDWVR